MKIWDKTKIKKARELKGLSVREAAELLDISSVYLSFLENGNRRVNDLIVEKMSKVYSQSASFFLNDEIFLPLS